MAPIGGGFGFACGKSLAFCYVQTWAAAPGTELEILVLGEPRRATVLGEPVYGPANRHPRMEGGRSHVRVLRKRVRRWLNRIMQGRA